MKFNLKIKGKNYEIEILEDGGETKIKIGKKEFIFREKGGIPIAQTSFPKRNFSKKEISAPIAGTISEIFIKEGDFVKEGKKLFLLSAMKMENEIISEFEGKVKKILVKKNQKVKTGEVLAVLE